jgi:replication factor A1
VIAIKGAKLTNYSGRSLNAPENAKILMNPDIPRAKELKEWYTNLNSTTSLKSLSLDGKASEGRQNNERLVLELPGYLEDEFLKKGTDKNIYFVINGYVHHIKNDERNVYNSCPEDN